MELGVSYIPPANPRHVAADLGELAQMGCSHVLFALQENHLDTLPGPVRHGPALARAAGLEPQVVIWGFLNTFGGGRMSRIMLEDPTIWRREPDGRPRPLACLNNPAVVGHLTPIVTRLRDAGFSTLFIDEPSGQQCFCEHCARLYARFGDEPLAAAAQTPGAQGNADAYRAFRQWTVVDYIRRASAAVKQADRDMGTTCCLMPHDRACWSAAASDVPTLDVLGTDPYWLLPSQKLTFDQALRDARDMHALCGRHGKRSQIWLNGWAIPAGVEEQIYQGGLALAAVGFDSFFTWSYRGGIGTNEECDRPDVAWAQVVRLYRELSGRCAG